MYGGREPPEQFLIPENTHQIDFLIHDGIIKYDNTSQIMCK
jgi:hypothetical protein